MKDLQLVTLLYSFFFFFFFVRMCTKECVCILEMLEDVCWCSTHFSGLYPSYKL